jgi:hypothetical protein
MAVEQLPSAKYLVAGQPTLGGAYANKYDVISADYGEVRDEEDETPWLQAPATSNLLEMKLSDSARPNATFSAPQRSGRRQVLSPLTIHLRFKPSAYGSAAGLVWEYEYYFDDRAEGRAVRAPSRRFGVGPSGRAGIRDRCRSGLRPVRFRPRARRRLDRPPARRADGLTWTPRPLKRATSSAA